MNAGELSQALRKTCPEAERIIFLELEIEQREQEITRLKIQMNQKEDWAPKVTKGLVSAVKDYARRNYSYRTIAKTFDISPATVSLIVNDKYKTKSLGNVHGGV